MADRSARSEDACRGCSSALVSASAGTAGKSDATAAIAVIQRAPLITPFGLLLIIVESSLPLMYSMPQMRSGS